MTDKSVTVGVLGGMGPLGTLDFLERLITLTPAEDDIDHIRTIVDNNPKVPSRIEYFINKSMLQSQLCTSRLCQPALEKSCDKVDSVLCCCA